MSWLRTARALAAIGLVAAAVGTPQAVTMARPKKAPEVEAPPPPHMLEALAACGFEGEAPAVL